MKDNNLNQMTSWESMFVHLWEGKGGRTRRTEALTWFSGTGHSNDNPGSSDSPGFWFPKQPETGMKKYCHLVDDFCNYNSQICFWADILNILNIQELIRRKEARKQNANRMTFQRPISAGRNDSTPFEKKKRRKFTSAQEKNVHIDIPAAWLGLGAKNEIQWGSRVRGGCPSIWALFRACTVCSALHGSTNSWCRRASLEPNPPLCTQIVVAPMDTKTWKTQMLSRYAANADPYSNPF